MAVDGAVRIEDDPTGQNIDNAVVYGPPKDPIDPPVGEEAFLRQRITVGDPDDFDATAAVLNTDPAADAHGIVVRVVGNETFRQPVFHQGTVSAVGVVAGLTAIDGSGISVLDIQHRGVLGQFKFTTVVEGTNDPTATGSEAPGSASTAVGWTTLELRGANGSEVTNIILGGRYLLFNPPRKVRVRCSSYTYGAAQIDVMAKPVSQEDPSRTLSDKDALASLALTTFGQMQIAERTFLVGGNFDETTLDTEIWEDISSDGGVHAFANGVIELHTGTSATGRAGIRSFQLANVLGAADNVITVRAATNQTTNGKYAVRYGVYTDLEGTFIQLAGNGRTLTDAVFNATTTLTSTLGDFTAADLGKRVDSTGNVTAGTTIVRIDSATQVTLSAAALASASGQTATVEGMGYVFVTRKGGVDTTSPFGIIGFAAIAASTALQLWETTFNPNFLIVRNSGNFVQLQVGSTVLSAMFNQYDLPLCAEAVNFGSTADNHLHVQTLVAERLGQQATIRAAGRFKRTDIVEGVAAIIHGEQPDGDIIPARQDGEAFISSATLVAGGVLSVVSTGLGSPRETLSGAFNSDGYNTIEIGIFSDVTGSATVEYCDDVDDPSASFFAGPAIEYGLDNVNRLISYPIPVGLDGFRITYTNNSVTGQSTFLFAVQLRTTTPGPPKITLDANVSDTQEAIVGRVALVAPDETGGSNLSIGRGGSGESLNVHVTGIHDDVHGRPASMFRARQFIIGATPVRVDVPTLGSSANPRRAVSMQSRGSSWWAYSDSENMTFLGDTMLMPPNARETLAIDADIPVYVVCEQTTGAQVIQSIAGASATGTGTDPTNAVVSDNTYATISAVGQTVRVTGFVYTPTPGSTIESVRLACEGKKQSGQFETVTHQETLSGSTTGSGSVSSASLAGGTEQLYVAFVSRNATNTITSVSGGGQTFAQQGTTLSTGGRSLDVWTAHGTFSAGAVTATMSTSTNAHISVSRLQNADPTVPIQAISQSTDTGTAVTAAGLAGTDKGFALLAVTHEAASGTAGAGYTERTDLSNGSGSNTDSLYTETKPLTSTGTETGTATLASSTDWGAIAVTVSPRAAIDPVLTLSYETPDGTPGATDGDITLTSTTDGTQFLIVTGDLSWAEANIDALVVIATGLTIGSATADIDRLYVEVTDTTGNTIRMSVLQLAGEDAP